MADVTLSAVTQRSLFDTQRLSALQQISQERLSTGLRVNRPTDNAQSFFAAQSLTNRASSLFEAKDRANQAVSALGAAQSGINAINRLADLAEAVALSARGGTTAEREAAAQQFDEIRSQINNLANDVSFGGVSLISSVPNTLDVSFSDNSGSSLSIVGVPSDSQALGISSAVATGNNFATDADIQNAVGEIASAVTTLRSTSSSLGTNNAVLSIREEFSTNIANIAEEGAAKLTEADLNEEAAVQVSLQAQGELSLLGASIANQTNQSILDLFSS
jgi:flagellin